MLFQWIQEFRQIMKRGAMKSTDWGKVVEKAALDVKSAERKVRDAEAAHEKQYFDCIVRDDQMVLARLRKAVRDAKEELYEARQAHARVFRERDAARAAEALADVHARWRESEKIAKQWAADGEGLDLAAQHFAEQIDKFSATSEKLRSTLPVPPRNSEMGSLMWARAVLKVRLEMRLFALTDGLLGSGGGNSPYTLRQGPSFAAYAKESALRALIAKPRNLGAEPVPPPDEAA